MSSCSTGSNGEHATTSANGRASEIRSVQDSTENSSRPEDTARMPTIQTSSSVTFPKKLFCKDSRVVPRAGCTVSIVEPLYQMMGLSLSAGRTRFESPTSLGHSGLEGCHGLRGASENPERKLGGHSLAHVVEDESASAEVCKSVQRAPGRPRACVVAWTTASPWCGRYQTRVRTIQRSLNRHRRLRQEKKEEARFLELLETVAEGVEVDTQCSHLPGCLEFQADNRNSSK